MKKLFISLLLLAAPSISLSATSPAFVPKGTTDTQKQSFDMPPAPTTAVGKGSTVVTCNKGTSKMDVKVVFLNKDATAKQKADTQIQGICANGFLEKTQVPLKVTPKAVGPDQKATAVWGGIKIPTVSPQGILEKVKAFVTNTKSETQYISASWMCDFPAKQLTFALLADGDKVAVYCDNERQDAGASSEMPPVDPSGQGQYGQGQQTSGQTGGQTGGQVGSGSQSAQDALNAYGGDDSPTGQNPVGSGTYGSTMYDPWSQYYSASTTTGTDAEYMYDSEDTYGYDTEEEWTDDTTMYDPYGGSGSDFGDTVYGEVGGQAVGGTTTLPASASEGNGEYVDNPLFYGIDPNLTSTDVSSDFFDSLLAGYKDPATGEFNWENMQFESMQLEEKYPGWDTMFGNANSFEQALYYYPDLTESEYSLMSMLYANHRYSWDFNPGLSSGVVQVSQEPLTWYNPYRWWLWFKGVFVD